MYDRRVTYLNRIEYPPILICPLCRWGSDALFETALSLGPWDLVRCSRCQRDFEKAEAIDEMVVRGDTTALVQWAGAFLAFGSGTCAPGDVALLDVRQMFERVYRVNAGASGSHLAGGISAHYVEQGYLMVAVAAHDNIPAEPVTVTVQATGQPPSAPELPVWKTLLLEASIAPPTSWKLAVILSVAALDVFFESLSGDEVRQNRPNVYDRLYARATGIGLKSLMGDDYTILKSLMGVRDRVAHGRDHLDVLSKNLVEEEKDWIDRGRLYPGRIAPSAEMALRIALRTIRTAQRRGPAPSTIGP